MRLKCSVVSALVVVAVLFSGQTASAQTDVDARFELLEHHITELHDQSESGRKWGGGISMALGAPFLAGAFYLDHLCSGRSDENQSGCTAGVWALGITGGVLFGTGLLILALPGEEETETQAWLDDAGATSGSAMVLRGEGLLRQLSDSGRTARYISGGVILGIGALGVVTTLTDSETSNTGAVTTGVVWGGIAALQFLLLTPAEKQWEGYQKAVAESGGSVRSESLFDTMYVMPAPVAAGGGVVFGTAY